MYTVGMKVLDILPDKTVRISLSQRELRRLSLWFQMVNNHIEACLSLKESDEYPSHVHLEFADRIRGKRFLKQRRNQPLYTMYESAVSSLEAFGQRVNRLYSLRSEDEIKKGDLVIPGPVVSHIYYLYRDDYFLCIVDMSVTGKTLDGGSRKKSYTYREGWKKGGKMLKKILRDIDRI